MPTAAKTPPSQPVVLQHWGVPLLLPWNKPWPQAQLPGESQSRMAQQSPPAAEVTCAVPPYRAWQGKRWRRPHQCSRVGVGAARPWLRVLCCYGGTGTIGE